MSGEQEICAMSAAELARRIRNKELSPLEVTRAFLDRIRRRNPEINAFCTVTEEEALKGAEKAEKRLMSGEEPPPLLGVPIAIKDLTPTKGIRTTYGSVFFADHVPDRDSVIVTRAKRAGAVILGKTNTPEFGYAAVTDNPLFGRTNNPHDPGRTAGGSSGGSAAAVAAGMAPIAEGSDGGGSIRIPAGFCGVYGLKPTFGRIPHDTGPTRFSIVDPFLHHGSLSKSVEDAALFLDVFQGPHPDDPFSLPVTERYFPLEPPDLKGWRIAYSPNLDYYEVDREVRAVVEGALCRLEEWGCRVEEVSLGLEYGEEIVTKTFINLWSVWFAAHFGHFLKEGRDRMSRGLVSTIEHGLHVSAVEMERWRRNRSEVHRRVEKVWESFDLLVTPTLAVTAFPHGRNPEKVNGKPIHPHNGWMLTYLFNLTGHPAASFPCGRSAEGLPVGMQIIGPRFSEKRILQLSRALEQSVRD